MTYNGWIKLHRSLFDNPVVTASSDSLTIWLFLLANASISERKVCFKGKEITLKRGQLITSRKMISQCVRNPIHESTVQRTLDKFKKANMITPETTKKDRLITITNWDKYQDGKTFSSVPNHTEKTTDEQQKNFNRTHKKNVKNNKTANNKRNLDHTFSNENCSFDPEAFAQQSIFDEKQPDESG